MASNSKNRGQALIEMIIYVTIIAGFFIFALMLSRTMSHTQEGSRFKSTLGPKSAPLRKPISGFNP